MLACAVSIWTIPVKHAVLASKRHTVPVVRHRLAIGLGVLVPVHLSTICTPPVIAPLVVFCLPFCTPLWLVLYPLCLCLPFFLSALKSTCYFSSRPWSQFSAWGGTYAQARPHLKGCVSSLLANLIGRKFILKSKMPSLLAFAKNLTFPINNNVLKPPPRTPVLKCHQLEDTTAPHKQCTGAAKKAPVETGGPLV